MNFSDKDLNIRLLGRQQGKCFICGEYISETEKPHVDHIKPRSLGGKDDENNYAITHASCNMSKQDADLELARRLHILDKIKNINPNQDISLEHVLKFYNGSSEILKFELSDTSFTAILDNQGEISSPVYTDHLSKERSIILDIPIKYLYFDNYINPRPINTISIGKLSKEFYKGNPQLHLILARIDYTDSNKIKVFDGQHKAVAQLLLSNEKTKHLLIRLFISENNRDRLVETNKKAGKELAQVAFSANVVRQLQNAIFKEKLRQYLAEKNLPEDSPYTETMLLEYFKGYRNFKTVILDAARDEITHSPKNSLKAYMSMEGKGKDLPLSYSSFTKSILTLMDPNFICPEDSNDEDNSRLLEINQLIRFCNIIGDTILNGKYNCHGPFDLARKPFDLAKFWFYA